MAGNRIELWGCIRGAPELRTTPAGSSVLRIIVDAADLPGEFALPVVMTGEQVERINPVLQTGAEVRVVGTLRAVRRRLKSGLADTAYEVSAELIERRPSGREK